VPGPPPTSLPPGLPAELVPDGATVYALTLPGETNEPGAVSVPDRVLYVVGPKGSRCDAMRGNYVAIRITGPDGTTTGHVELPHGGGPALFLSCPYIPAAEAAYRTYHSDPLSPTFDPAVDCAVRPGEQATPIATGVMDGYLALVVSPPTTGNATSPTTVALYTFQEGPDNPDGGATEADCTLPASQRAICVATFGFFLAQFGVGGMTETRRAEVYEELAAILAR
jgi:hypothetical protein